MGDYAVLDYRKSLIFSIFISASLLDVSFLYAEMRSRDTDHLGLSGPVKELTEKQSTFKMVYGDWVQQNEYPLYKMTFDTKGKKIKETRYNNHGIRSQEIDYVYDSAGRKIKEIMYDNSGLKSQEIDYIYSDAGRLKEIRDDSAHEERIQRYDESGEKIEEIRRDKDSNSVEESWEIIENADGMTVEYKDYYKSGVVNIHETTSFDRVGRMTEKLEKRYSDFRQWRYEYDSAGNLIQGEFYDESYLIPVDVWSSSYNERGDPVEIRQIVVWYSKSGAVEFTWTYIFQYAIGLSQTVGNKYYPVD
jgi:hypothetical protein